METLDIKGLMEKHPKTADKITGYFMTYLQELQNKWMEELGEDPTKIPIMEKSSVENFIFTTLSKGLNYQLLFNMFDLNEIYLSILFKGKDNWIYEIANSDVRISGNGRPSRGEAAVAGIESAFKELEDNLNKQ